MEIYLVRHTTPAVEKGVCYGQADIDTTDSFIAEAAIIKNHLPGNIETVYSSPLKRCQKLAAHLFPHHAIELHNDLKEINCGQWELKKWDDIAKEEIDPWMNDFVNVRIPDGESYVDVFERTSKLFVQIHQQAKSAIIVAHGGVIRSILSYITHTALVDSFNVFKLHYGCVVKVDAADGILRHSILSNIVHAKETHKPSHL